MSILPKNHELNNLRFFIRLKYIAFRIGFRITFRLHSTPISPFLLSNPSIYSNLALYLGFSDKS